jgi:hypothetical protein
MIFNRKNINSMGLRSAPKAIVGGSTTAADGNSNVVLLGGIPTMISGIGVY